MTFDFLRMLFSFFCVLLVAGLCAAQQQCQVFVNSSMTLPLAVPCGNSSSTACLTIQQAVDAVNSLTAAQLMGCDNVTISLGGGTYRGAGNVGVTLQFNLTAPVATIYVGDIVDNPTVDGQLQVRDGPLWTVLATTPNQTLQVSGVQFVNGSSDAAGGGGALIVATVPTAGVTLAACAFTGNVAKVGGALVVLAAGADAQSGRVRVDFCNFFNNTASAEGFFDTAAGTCSAGGGAAFVSSQSDTVFNSCQFEGNVASCGGALFAQRWSGSSALHACDFAHNIAKRGGAIFAFSTSSNGTAHWHDLYFTENRAAIDGGAIFCAKCQHVTRHVYAEVNSAQGAGGAAYLFNSATLLHNFTFTNNFAVADGGALYITGAAASTNTQNAVTNSTFELNAVTGPAARGPAVYCKDTRVTFAPYAPDAFCSLTCTTPEIVCACKQCTDPAGTTTVAPAEAPKGSIWAWLAPLLILIALLIGGGVWFYRRRGSSNRAKFLNI